jgi:DnaJ-class molecular chaperone
MLHQCVTISMQYWGPPPRAIWLNLSCHDNSPDKNEDASHEKFQAIQGAYEILADPEKRAAYDNYGSDGSNAQSDDPFGYSGRPHGFDDIFESMFGNDFFGAGMGSSGAGASQPRKKRKTRGDDQKIELTVTLEEAYSGKEKKLEIEKRVICPKCEGCVCRITPPVTELA